MRAPCTTQKSSRSAPIALLTPITTRYLGHLETKLNADLALRVNGKFMALRRSTLPSIWTPRQRRRAARGRLEAVRAQDASARRACSAPG